MKRDYLLQIADNTTKILSNNIPNYTTNKVGFKKWFESDIYRDEIFLTKRKFNEKVQTTYNKIIFEQKFENVNYQKARLLATNSLIENKNMKNKDYLTNDIILKSTERGNNIIHKMKWKAASNGNVVFEGWDYYKNNKLSIGDNKYSFKVAQITMWFLTIFFIISFILSIVALNLSDDFDQSTANTLKTGLGYLNFIGGLTYSSFVTTIRDEFNSNVQSKDKILSHNIKLEIPFWIAALTTLINFVYEELSFLSTILVIVSAIILLSIKLLFDYDSDVNKYYSNEQEKVQKS